MSVDEQIRAVTGLPEGVASEEDLATVAQMYGVDVWVAGDVPVWVVYRIGADLLSTVAGRVASSPQVSTVEDITLTTVKASELLALASDLRARADTAENAAGGGDIFVVDFAPYGSR